jgi:hypothetical protein
MAHTLSCMYAPPFWHPRPNELRGGAMGKQCRRHPCECRAARPLCFPGPAETTSAILPHLLRTRGSPGVFAEAASHRHRTIPQVRDRRYGHMAR